MIEHRLRERAIGNILRIEHDHMASAAICVKNIGQQKSIAFFGINAARHKKDLSSIRRQSAHDMCSEEMRRGVDPE